MLVVHGHYQCATPGCPKGPRNQIPCCDGGWRRRLRTPVTSPVGA